MTRATGRPGFAPGSLRLPTGLECDVWRAPVVAGRWEPFAVLDAEEEQRYQRFRRPADRARYATAHTLVRLLLAAYLDSAPDELRFDRTCTHCGAQHGKPRLRHSESTVEFSLSHAGDRVLVAIAERPVGVDVEQLNRVADVASLAEATLSPAERRWFDAQPPERRESAFYTYWTRKEAALKATAHGLRVPMSALTTTPPDEPAELLAWTADEPLAAPVRLQDLTAEPNYLSCVAVLGSEPVRATERDAPQPS